MKTRRSFGHIKKSQCDFASKGKMGHRDSDERGINKENLTKKEEAYFQEIFLHLWLI